MVVIASKLETSAVKISLSYDDLHPPTAQISDFRVAEFDTFQCKIGYPDLWKWKCKLCFH